MLKNEAKNDFKHAFRMIVGTLWNLEDKHEELNGVEDCLKDDVLYQTHLRNLYRRIIKQYGIPKGWSIEDTNNKKKFTR